MKSPTRTTRPAGFTLLELIIAMAVAALLAVSVLPAMGGIAERGRNAELAHRLTASLALARISAIRTGTPVSLCPSSDGRHCRGDNAWNDGWLVFSDPQRNGEPAAPSAIIESSGGAGTGLMVSTTGGRTRVTYDAWGWSAGTNTTFRVCSANGRLLGKVVVNNAGRTRTERPRAGARCPG
ncbi:GspH/FimT family pseudopilin [Marilutibacter chinensis]|uniref:Type II secretion system protein H n=1 Tax=Marilutibacter chinensis TaxID=2912247 RepID=A0ABS9HWT1_9GAMM|nr:GspH/FimT family pseudopilin [Lysobacter chinensis]MCF7222795.1 GspH/FimT family pseudopilin [Lysobacter chinensis]